jgi:hypothetical protein
MEPNLFPYSQQLAAGPGAEPDESSWHPHVAFFYLNDA